MEKRVAALNHTTVATPASQNGDGFAEKEIARAQDQGSTSITI
jgi:hypothetical protein